MTIPAIIHQYWSPAKTLPFHIAEMIATWKKHHPQFDYFFWTERNLFPLVNQSIYDNAERITPEAPDQLRSDVARYEILWRYGGVYVDADFICCKPITPLLANTSAFAGRETARWLNNALIGIEDHHPLMAELVERLPQNVSRHPVRQANTVKTGPQFFTPIARRYRITEYPTGHFYPFSYRELERRHEDFPDAYAIHQWQNQSRLQGVPLGS